MLVAGLTGFILLLVGFAVTQAIQLRRITRERDRADRVTSFMTDMFNVSDPNEARGNTVTAREILDRSSAQIDQSLAKDLDLRARMMAEMGAVYQNLGLYSRSESLLQKALDIQRGALGEENSVTLSSMNLLAHTLTLQGRYSEGEALARRTADLSRKVFGPRSPEALKTTNTLVGVLISQGRLDEAEALARQNLESAEASLGTDNVDTARYMGALATIETSRTHFEEAEKLLLRALEIRTRMNGPEHPDSLKVMNNLAVAAAEGGNP